MYGSDEEEIKFSYDDGYESYNTKKTFEGVINNLERRYLETDSEWKREEISQYQSESDCEKCKGLRLKEEALCVKINSLNISEITKKSIDEAVELMMPMSSDKAVMILSPITGMIEALKYNQARKNKDVFFDDAMYKQTNPGFTRAEAIAFDNIIRMSEGSAYKAGAFIDKIKKDKNTLSLGVQLKTFFNIYIRQGTPITNTSALVNNFEVYFRDKLQKEIDGKKQASTKQKFIMLIFLQNHLTLPYQKVLKWMERRGIMQRMTMN